MLQTKEFDDGIYRLVEEIQGVPHTLGTAFHIGQGVFLTCWHVLAAHESLSGTVVEDESIYFEGNTYLIGGKPERLYNLKWKRHWDKENNQFFDVAAGCLPEGELLPLALPFELLFNPDKSGDLVCCGYGENEATMKGERTFHYAGNHSKSGYFVLDKSLAPGYSGSPIFHDKKVIGLACADNIQKSCTLGVKLVQIYHWLESSFGFTPPPPQHPTTGFTSEQHQIMSYGFAVGFSLHELPVEELIDIATQRLQTINAVEDFIRKVNTNVLQVTDFPNAKKLVAIDEFSLSKFNVNEMLRDCLLAGYQKSSRTLAAILETDSIFQEEFLTKEQASTVRDVKALLKKS